MPTRPSMAPFVAAMYGGGFSLGVRLSHIAASPAGTSARDWGMRCTVVMRLRSESKGTSATLGKAWSRSSL